MTNASIKYYVTAYGGFISPAGYKPKIITTIISYSFIPKSINICKVMNHTITCRKATKGSPAEVINQDWCSKKRL